VQSVNEEGLCFSCGVLHLLASILAQETDLGEDEALDLAGDLHDCILSAIIERLMSPGEEHPLVMELLENMKRREKPN
jgi:hypothetical protein